MRNPMLDKDFLYDLNQYKHKELYAKIISLNFQELPLEEIEGRITQGGPLNIDGNSAVRRTCNLTLVAKDINLTDFYWSVSNKFKLEIGLRNFINKDYPDIIWFKQGIYVITSFNSALTNNNYTISISGKDKMCLLNGDMGGNLSSSVDFGKIDTYKSVYSIAEIKDQSQYKAGKYYTYNSGNKQYELSNGPFDKQKNYYIKDDLLEQEDLPLKQIIREAVHTYGKEPYHNIVINDLDESGLELLEYRGEVDLYLLYNEDANIYDQITLKGEFEVYPENGGIIKLEDCKKNTAIAIEDFNEERTIFYIDEEKKGTRYSVTKISFSDNEGILTAGYRITDLVYAGELISSIGETVTSILDKIKNMLGSFEYFYDVDGRFIFQAKKVYANHHWNSLKQPDDNVFARDAIEESPYAYSFEDVNLIQKFQNTPTLNNLKNDYSIWGVRKGVSGAEIPIHARYAIHEKPEYYKSYDGIVYTVKDYDWRELIYQMAVDYYKYNQDPDFYYNITRNNITKDKNYYPTGDTGYEMFYSDLQGFWRELYNPEAEPIYEMIGGYYKNIEYYKTEAKQENFKDCFIRTDKGIEKVSEDAVFDEKQQYYTDNKELASEETFIISSTWIEYEKKKDNEGKEIFQCDYFLKPKNESEKLDTKNYSEINYYWNKNVIEAPDLLNYWLDFYEGGADLQRYSISVVGDRPKVVNDSKITSIYFRDIPQIIYLSAKDAQVQEYNRKTGYTYIQLTKEIEDLFTISAQGKSAQEEMNSLINQYSYCVEGLTVTTIPIYNLEPNSLIYIHNDENHINGKYQVSKITLPLTYNGMMSITATKVIDPIY